MTGYNGSVYGAVDWRTVPPHVLPGLRCIAVTTEGTRIDGVLEPWYPTVGVFSGCRLMCAGVEVPVFYWNTDRPDVRMLAPRIRAVEVLAERTEP